MIWHFRNKSDDKIYIYQKFSLLHKIREVQTEPYLPQIIESLPNIPSAPPIPPIGQNMPPKSAQMPQQILCARCKHDVEDC